MYEPLPSSRQRHSQNDPLIFPSLSSDHFLLSLINCAFIALLSFARGTQSIRLQKRDTPKTTRKPFQGHGRRCWPRPPWPLQRSAARPRRNGLSEPHIAAPSGLGAEDARRTAGQLQLPSRNKAYSHGMFLQAVGQNSEYRSQISDPPSILFVCFSVRHGENKSSNHRNICSCSIVLFKPYQQLHLAYFCSIMRRVSRNYFMKNVGLSKCG